jgi:hypothetical protein
MLGGYGKCLVGVETGWVAELVATPGWKPGVARVQEGRGEQGGSVPCTAGFQSMLYNFGTCQCGNSE